MTQVNWWKLRQEKNCQRSLTKVAWHLGSWTQSILSIVCYLCLCVYVCVHAHQGEMRHDID